MYSFILASLFSLATAQSSGFPLATTVSNSPAGQTAVAQFPFSGPRKNITGSVSFVSNANGEVQVSVNLQGLPSAGMPFIYHVHEYPVTGDNCTSTGAHLDPSKRGEVPICDASVPASCQVGDLSGKYGNITTTSISQTYQDPFLAFNPASPNSFIGKSVTIHLFNKTRIACSNITLLSTSGSSASGASGASNATVRTTPSGTAGASAAGSSSASSSRVPTAGSAASTLQVSAGLLFAAIFAML